MVSLETDTKEMYVAEVLVFFAKFMRKFQIAVDEIVLMDGECPPSAWCDFETSYCGWTNDTTGDFYWTRAQKATDSSGTGPTTGLYLAKSLDSLNFLIFYRSYYLHRSWLLSLY